MLQCLAKYCRNTSESSAIADILSTLWGYQFLEICMRNSGTKFLELELNFRWNKNVFCLNLISLTVFDTSMTEWMKERSVFYKLRYLI